MEKNKMRAEYYSLSKLLSFILGKPCPVKETKDGLGHTASDGKKNTIYVAYSHEIMDTLSESERVVFRMGIAAHELCHRLFTNFTYTNAVIECAPTEQKQLLMQYINILEDPAIEYFASTRFGGKLLKALRFTIGHTYKMAPKLNECENSTPLSEYLKALVMFGDMGIIKGYFRHPDAKKAFYETAQKFYDGTHEPNGRKRIDIACEIFKDTEYLWKGYCEDIKAMQKLVKMLEKMGSENTSGSGMGSSPDSQPEGTSAEKAKTKTLKEIMSSSSFGSSPSSDGASSDEKSSSESGDKSSENEEDDKSGSGKDGDDKEGTFSSNENKENDTESPSENEESKCESSEKGEKANSSDDDENGEDKDSSSDGNSDKDSEKNSDKTGKGDFSEISEEDKEFFTVKKDKGSNDRNPCDSANSKSQKDGTPAIGSCSEGEFDEESIEWGEYILTEDEITEIMDELDREVEQLENDDVNDAVDTTPLMDMAGIHSAGRCLNQRIKNEISPESYNAIVTRMMPQIKRTTKILKDIFADDKERKVMTNAGKLNTKALYASNGYVTRKGEITENIFVKKIHREEKSNLAIAIAVDESGSMGCGAGGGKSRAEVARECAIAFAEIFNNLNVPIYIMGFEADDGSYDTVHNHYITWKNSKKDRLSLMNIKARYNNRDGVSIRYLTKILKKHPAKNKLLIVLSDGAPAACNYSNGSADTASAVREASSLFPVLGVSIGNSSQDTLADFYKQNFIVVNQNDDLFLQVARKLRKMLR